MATNHDIPELDRKGLREFGIVTGLIVAVLFGLFFPWVLGLEWPTWPWIVFAVLALWGLVAPDSLNPVYKVWMRFGLMLSKITTPIVLGVVFYLIFTPVAFVLRLKSKDALKRELDPDAASYRVPSAHTTKESLERPF